jgi:hydrophobic/amphiphilic exporter-1 (mainly G- bacteria), HAE1 family
MFKRVVERPIAVFMLSLAAALFGLLAYQQLSVSLMPPLSYPSLTVLTNYPGAAPEEVEIEITNLLEERLSTLEGLTSIRSRSLSGQSEITLALRWATQLDQALQRVYERLDRVELPNGVASPQVLRYDPTLEPLLVLALAPKNEGGDLSTISTSSLAKTRRYADEVLSPLLYQVDGVAAVKVTGGDQALIDIRVHIDTLQRLGLTIEEVSQALRAAHINQAGGLLHTESGDILIRTISEIKTLDGLKALVIKKLALTEYVQDINSEILAEGGWITLQDIAEVEQRFVERTSWVQLNQSPAIRVQVYRQSEGDMVSISTKVKEMLFGRHGRKKNVERVLQVPHPEGLEIELISDQAYFIERALSEVNQAIGLGGLLAILILYAFLSSWTQTLIIAIAIPLSVILAFIPLQIFEVSLNLMSLGGLALGVGMLVDNAVVVLESIYRYREEGEPIKSAAELGVHEVASAVFASTLTTVAVFAPVAFIEGFAGQVFRDLALTVVSALIASLFVALFVVPTLAAHLYRTQKYEEWTLQRPHLKPNQWIVWYQKWGILSFKGKCLHLLLFPIYWLEGTLSLFSAVLLVLSLSIIGGLKLIISPPLRVILVPLRYLSVITSSLYELTRDAYVTLLSVTMRFPSLVVLGSVLLLTLGGYLLRDIPRALLPDVAQGVVIAELEYPVGTSLEGTQRRIQPWVTRLLQLEEVERVDVIIGQDESDEQPGERRAPHQARLTISLSKPSFESGLNKRLRSWMSREAGASLRLSKPTLIHINAPVRIVVKGQSLSQLQEVEEQVIKVCETMPELSDIEKTFGRGSPEVQIIYDHAKLRHLGLSPQTLAQQLKNQLSGLNTLELLWDGEKLPVRVRADYADQIQRDDLSTLPIKAAQNANISIPLGSLVTFKSSEGPAEIRHVDGQRAAEITAYVSAFELDYAAQKLDHMLSLLHIPSNMELLTDGQEKEMRESTTELSLVLLISLFLVFVVMATQFESVRLPLLIMGAVPFALIGVIGGLWLTNTPLSVVVFVGMITLGGVVVNNAIVFVDAIQRIREKYPSQSILITLKSAGARRLRPILMTTLTTLIGLLPMLGSSGEGSELRSPLALTLIFGLSFSTILVLFVIPALYQLFIPSVYKTL